MGKGVRAVVVAALLIVLFAASAASPVPVVSEEADQADVQDAVEDAVAGDIPQEGVIDEAYRFPPSANATGTADAQRDAFWIPEDVLKRMTTRALAETVLSVGYMTQFTAYDNGLTAMMMLEQVFNIYPEMQARPDYYAALVELYEEAHVLTDEQRDGEDVTFEEIFYVTNLETLLAVQIHKNINAGLDTPEIKALDEVVKENSARINEERKGVESISVWDSGFYWYCMGLPQEERPQALVDLTAGL